MGIAPENRRSRVRYIRLGEAASAVSFSVWTGFETGLSIWVVAGWMGFVPVSGLLAALPVRLASAALLAVIGPAFCWARFVEPYRLGVTELAVRNGRPEGASGGRFVFVSDIHADGDGRRAARLASEVARAKPDFILLGGDYANDIGRRTLEELAGLVRALAGVAPVYAVIGNHDELRPEALDAITRAGARVLDDESVDVPGGPRVHGVNWLDAPGLRRAAGRLALDRPNVCLTHAPGLIPEAEALGFDLYLAGHTHGGQIRLPWWGAILTCDPLGKRFEAGRYELQRMTAYVSRGLGTEGGLLGKMRFLAPPEVVSVRWGA